MKPFEKSDGFFVDAKQTGANSWTGKIYSEHTIYTVRMRNLGQAGIGEKIVTFGWFGLSLCLFEAFSGESEYP